MLMYTFKVTKLPVNVQIQEKSSKIILPLKQDDDNKQSAVAGTKEAPSKNEGSSDSSRSEEESDNDSKEGKYNPSDHISFTYESTACSAKYESAVNEVKSMLTLKEKIFLIGIARYLDGRDFSLIKKYVANGATQEELDGLWSQIKAKLPEDDYDKVYDIFLKYKR